MWSYLADIFNLYIGSDFESVALWWLDDILWKGTDTVGGGHCLLALPKICIPLELCLRLPFLLIWVIARNLCFFGLLDRWLECQSIMDFGSLLVQRGRSTHLEN